MSDSVRDEHEVVLNIDIVVGVNPAQTPLNCFETIREGQRKRIYEAIPPDHTFHLEYNLLPNGIPPRESAPFKTDVVTFGVVCKVHTDKDSRVIKAWEENGLLYYAWRHRHKLKVDHALLHALFDHTIEVRVWNTKAKLAPRAKFDRPKAFRLPAADTQGEIQNMAARPEKFPVVSHDQARQSRAMKTGSSGMGPGLAATSASGSSAVVPGMESSQAVPGMESSLVPIVVEEEGGGVSEAVVPHCSEEKTTIAGFTAVSPYAMQALPKQTTTRTSAEQAEEVRVEREGIAVLPLSLATLYGLSHTITSTLREGARNLKAMTVTLGVEEALMSRAQRRALNPLCITVCQARGIPPPPGASSSHAPEASDDSWEPVYVQYQLMGTTYRTSGRQRGPTVTWNETKVTLLGTRDFAHVVEYLRGPPTIIEVHDRDRRATPPPSRSVFGNERDDLVIGTQTYCKDKGLAARTGSPYGVARLDLSELLLGQRLIEIRLPVLNCPNAGHEGDDTVPRGDYLRSHTDLKIRVELAQPIVSPRIALQLGSPRSTALCPFGRLVYVVSREGQSFVQEVLDRVNGINARALGLLGAGGLSGDLINAALSTCKLTSDQIGRSDCDIITGFQACDGQVHVMVLEGLADSGLKDLWEGSGRHTSQVPEIVQVLYNSEYTFSSRLYGTLDVDITAILIPQPLGDLLGRAAFYTRGSVPEPCFRALLRLNDLKGTREMADVVRNDMLPTADQVISLSMHYSTPFPFQLQVQPQEKEEEPMDEVTSSRPVTPRPGDRSQQKLRREPLELTNPHYEVLLMDRRRAKAVDFVERNITHCQMLSLLEEKLDRQRRKHARSLSEGTREQAYNYSIQTLNSTEMSKARMRAGLSHDLKHRYTYCHDYLGATVAPFDPKEVQKAERLKSESQWLTPSGFVYPGHTTSLTSNMHPKTPDIARVEELMEAYQDSWLRASPQTPTAGRHGDFDLYTRAPVHVGPALPVTIHLAGDERKREVREIARREEEAWQSKVVVDDVRFRVHRKPAAMELRDCGSGASTQLDKLCGLLKDLPLKRSLRGVCPDDGLVCVTLPPWSEADEGSPGGYHPGPEGRSLKLDKNVIPVRVSRFPEPRPHHQGDPKAYSTREQPVHT